MCQVFNLFLRCKNLCDFHSVHDYSLVKLKKEKKMQEYGNPLYNKYVFTLTTVAAGEQRLQHLMELSSLQLP